MLLSDGQETSGDAVAQARLLQARGVEVDVVPLPSRSGPEALLDSVSAPSVVHEGERFSIGVRLVSNVATDGTVHVFVNGQPLADQAVSLTPGENMVLRSSYYAAAQLGRLRSLAERMKKKEAVLLREALDDLIRKYDRAS